MNLRVPVVAIAGIALLLAAHASADLSDRLEAERLEQSGTVISIVFDDSGSMEGSKIAQAKTAFRQWIAAVPASHRLGLVALNAGPLVPPGRDNRAALLAAVDRLKVARGTPLAATIRSTLQSIEQRRRKVGPYERHIMLVFTDGEDTTSERTPGVQRELARAAAAGVETVGIGYHGEGTYMRAAATRYYDASNLAELQNSLAKVDAEIGDTSDVLIDDRTRAAMQAVAPPQSSAAAAPATVAIPSQKPNTPHRSRHSSSPYVVVFFTLLWMRWRARKAARH
jgi:hypothetical protein